MPVLLLRDFKATGYVAEKCSPKPISMPDALFGRIIMGNIRSVARACFIFQNGSNRMHPLSFAHLNQSRKAFVAAFLDTISQMRVRDWNA